MLQRLGGEASESNYRCRQYSQGRFLSGILLPVAFSRGIPPTSLLAGLHSPILQRLSCPRGAMLRLPNPCSGALWRVLPPRTRRGGTRGEACSPVGLGCSGRRAPEALAQK